MLVDKLQGFGVVSQLEDESISVSQLNKLAKTLLENNMPVFWIKGEVSGIRNYNHIYFDLKDEGGKISCVLFARVLPTLGFSLENGQMIEVRGRVTIYPQNGSYQINVERVRQVGMGDLWVAYNRLLTKLKDEGLFALEHKKSLPLFPKTIGVITSKEGAVIRDVATTLKRRMPNIQIVVYHSLVQGMDAGMQIAAAIKTANRRREVDVLIICRGGGSMQDLWSFNEEVVARAVFESELPIISAIGHETDTTIIDFVADVRAPTPTAAAELVSKSREEWLNQVHKLGVKLHNEFESIINNKKQQLDLYYAQIKFLNPLNQLKHKQQVILLYQAKIKNAVLKALGKCRQQLDMADSQLKLLNPENVLSRGYAIVRNRLGKVISAPSDVKMHERLEVKLKDGVISVIADTKHNHQQEELI